jgi:N6-adenosine-specific RNA methylase IME4
MVIPPFIDTESCVLAPPPLVSAKRPIEMVVASARRALEVAGSFEEVKAVRDKAEALRAYLRSIDAARDAQNDCAEIKIRAERRMGDELARIEKNAGGRPVERTGDTMSPVSNQAVPPPPPSPEKTSNIVLPVSTPAATATATILPTPPPEQPAQARAAPSEPPTPPPSLAELGISKMQSSRWQAIAGVPDEAFEDHVAGVKQSGDELTTAGVYRLAKQKRNQEALVAVANRVVAVPTGRYSCIVIDPPWPMQKIEREVRPNQVGFEYPTMSEDELAAFPVPHIAADDCHLFCWTTQKFLFMANRLIEAWGFRYVCQFIWHKPGGFQPIGLPQYNCEFALYARRGTPKFVDLKQFSCCFNAPRREHSRKPDEFYDMVRRVTAAPRIDVFSREAREGFAQYGNEAEKFASGWTAPLSPSWSDDSTDVEPSLAAMASTAVADLVFAGEGSK